MMTTEEIRELIVKAVPAAAGGVAVEQNTSVCGQHWLRVQPDVAIAVAKFLRDSELKLDYLSNVTGVDWPEKEVTEKVKVKKVVDGAETEVEETVKRKIPGCLEVVYHFYSMEKRTDLVGPVVLKMRTVNRTDQVELPSLTPVWRSAEFQEREVFDLYGVVFTGHPDLRRIMMWNSFKDHPMRRDYVEPDDFEYEPTPHDQVMKRAEEHRAKLAAANSSEGGAA
jgi:NADH-quinone oxidoreductase subunit C